MKLTQKILKELIYYDPETGIFTWKCRREWLFSHCNNSSRICKMWNTKFCGTNAGYATKRSGTKYIIIDITLCGKRKSYLAHRLVWLYTIGEFPRYPELQIDHIDHNGLNNKFRNIRITDSTGNSKNSGMYENNTSGFNGVGWSKSDRKWRVRIGINGKRICGGRFLLLDDAIEKRKQMNIEHGFHKNHGRK